MRKHLLNGIFALVVRRSLPALAALALVLVGAGVSRAQSGSASVAAQPAKNEAPAPELASPGAKAAANPSAEARSSGGMNTGVKVHGHWTIVVRNPDGTVTDRRDFENSLALSGAYLLQNILGGTMTPGAWAISLGAQGAGKTGPCGGQSFAIVDSPFPSPVSNGNCFILEPTGIYGGPPCAGCFTTNLTRQQMAFQISEQPVLGNDGGPIHGEAVEAITGGGFELTGSATTSVAGTIDTVATSLMVCASHALDFTFSPPGTYTVLPTLSSLGGTDPNSCTTVGELGGLSAPSQAISIAIGGTGFKGFGGIFSSTLLNGATATSTPPSAVQVVANQTVQVTVVFTFN
jgi:hypothetical protein